MRITSNPAIAQALESGRLAAPKAQAGEKGGDFAQTLMDVIKEVNTSQQDSRRMQEDFITGRRPVDIQDVMISMEKASTAMQLTIAVRNKMLEAYQEINKMQV